MDQLVSTLSPLLERVRTDVCWVKRPDGPVCLHSPLSQDRIKKHLNGGPAFGAAFIHAGSSTTRLASFDFDSHGGETTWVEMRASAMKVFEELEFRGLSPVAFRSTGGRGIHLYMIWDDEQDAYSVRRLLADVLAACGLKNGTGGVAKGQVEIFPKQDSVPQDGFGNMVVLPLAGQSVPLEPLASLADLPRDTPVQWVSSPAVPRLEKPTPEQLPPPDPASYAELQAMLAAIPDFSDRCADYETWRNTIFAIHYATDGSEEGRALAHTFSSRQPNYDPDMLDTKVWDYAGGNKDTVITDGFLKGLAGSFGYNPTTIDDFEDLGDDPAVPKDKPRRFAPVQAAVFADVSRPVHWHIHGILPQEGVSMVYGASGSGKTFAVLDMAAAVAQGIPWRSIRTHRGRVVYVVAESPGGFRKRLHAFSKQHGIPLSQIDVHIISVPPNLLDKAHVKELIKELNLLGDVALVVLDTLARVTTGGDENSAQDMGVAMVAAQQICDDVGCSVLLVHHSGKDSSQGARGSSAIRAALDAELEVSRSGDDRVLRVTKLKDGEEGAEFGFQLLTIALGEDEDGEQITSCVVVHNDSSAAAVKHMSGLSKAAEDVLAAVNARAVDVNGYVPDVWVTDVGPKGTKGVIQNLIKSGHLLSDGKGGLKVKSVEVLE